MARRPPRRSRAILPRPLVGRAWVAVPLRRRIRPCHNHNHNHNRTQPLQHLCIRHLPPPPRSHVRRNPSRIRQPNLKRHAQHPLRARPQHQHPLRALPQHQRQPRAPRRHRHRTLSLHNNTMPARPGSRIASLNTRPRYAI